jgi:hypothetical protein
MEEKNDEAHVCCIEDSCYKIGGLISPLDCVSAGGRIRKESDRRGQTNKYFVHTESVPHMAHGA